MIKPVGKNIVVKSVEVNQVSNFGIALAASFKAFEITGVSDESPWEVGQLVLLGPGSGLVHAGDENVVDGDNVIALVED